MTHIAKYPCMRLVCLHVWGSGHMHAHEAYQESGLNNKQFMHSGFVVFSDTGRVCHRISHGTHHGSRHNKLGKSGSICQSNYGIDMHQRHTYTWLTLNAKVRHATKPVGEQKQGPDPRAYLQCCACDADCVAKSTAECICQLPSLMTTTSNSSCLLMITISLSSIG